MTFCHTLSVPDSAMIIAITNLKRAGELSRGVVKKARIIPEPLSRSPEGPLLLLIPRLKYLQVSTSLLPYLTLTILFVYHSL